MAQRQKPPASAMMIQDHLQHHLQGKASPSAVGTMTAPG